MINYLSWRFLSVDSRKLSPHYLLVANPVYLVALLIFVAILLLLIVLISSKGPIYLCFLGQ